MRYVGLLLSFLLIVSCQGKKPEVEKIREGRDRASEKKKSALTLEQLRTVLAADNGLVVDTALVGADSVFFRLGLSKESISTWRKAEMQLGRPPIVAWATISADVALPGEEPTTYQIRLRDFDNLTPDKPRIRIALPKRPARASGDSPLLELPEGANLQCSVLAVRVK